MRYLVTGHTGFKGSWLSLMLHSQGHTVSGIALDPEPGSLYSEAGVAAVMEDDIRIDIRDAEAVSAAIQRVSPDVIFHLAAQPLVRESYRDPRYTFTTNVVGTLNVLEAAGKTGSVRANVIITTDKVYRNVGQSAGYVEGDALGAADPYSTSKAMADLLTQSWVTSFPGVPTAIARGGNVIGGGDTSRDRLLPDLFRAFAAGTPAVLRFPESIRPWQHVLDCLDGYLTIADALVAGGGTGEWNIGPGSESFVSVETVAQLASELWGDGARWEKGTGDEPHEANVLALDAGRAQSELGWGNLLRFPLSLEWSVDWQRQLLSGVDAATLTRNQIDAFYARKESRA